MLKDNFEFFIEADLIKSTGEKITKVNELDYDNMYLAGIASDSEKDIQGEILSPDKYDLQYIISGKGKVNWNHDSTKIIGEIIEAKVLKGNKLYVKARLLSTSQLAKDIYKNAFEMQSDVKSNIRLSWSVEGQAMERDEKDSSIVKRALITIIALTNTPVNYKHTFAEVVSKSLNATANIFATEANDFEKAILSNENLDELFKNDLIRLGLTPNEYTDNVLFILDKDKDLSIEKCHSILDIKKNLTTDLNSAYSLFKTKEKFNIDEVLIIDADLTDIEIRKAFVYFQCIQKWNSDENYEKTLNKINN